MSLPSIGHSVTGGTSPIPSHQAIGSNGSFWLPEKIDPSFGSKVKNSTPSKEGSRQGAGKSVVSGKPASGEKSFQGLLSLRESDCCRQGLHRGQVSQCSAFTLVEIRIIFHQGFAIEKPFFWIGPFRPRPSGQEQVLHAQQTKLTRMLTEHQLPFGGPFQRVRVARSGRQGNGDKHGARIVAQKMLYLILRWISRILSKILKYSDGEISRDPAASLAPKARSFMKFLSNAVSPRVAYLDKNTRKVVRFAVDLPNKTKLGVRLEESGGSLTLCFICSDPDSLEMLGFTREALSQSLSVQSGKTTRINVFSNYKEMDEHFLRAA